MQGSGTANERGKKYTHFCILNNQDLSSTRQPVRPSETRSTTRKPAHCGTEHTYSTAHRRQRLECFKFYIAMKLQGSQGYTETHQLEKQKTKAKQKNSNTNNLATFQKVKR